MAFLFWLFSRLPLSTLQALGGWLGALAVKVSGRYHDWLIADFRHAYFGVTPAMLKETGRSADRMVFEISYPWMRKNETDVAPYLFDVYRTVVEHTFADERGLIFLTPHLGCFEVLPQIYAHEHPVTSLFKSPHEASLCGWIEAMRAGPNMQVAPADPYDVRMLVRALEHDGAVGILPDQTLTAGEGIWVPFFGKPAYTMTLMHRLYRLTGASVAVLFTEQLPCGAGYRLYLKEIGNLPENAVQAATCVNVAVERLITVIPTQYLWGYNRYKHPKGADAPPAA